MYEAAFVHGIHPWVERLVKLVPPPGESQKNTQGFRDWERLSQIQQLPTDYLQISALYGAGGFYESLFIRMPKDHEGLWDEHIYHAEMFLETREALQRDLDKAVLEYRVHPEVGGLLFFARTVGSDRCFWRTHGQPDEWPITIVSRDLIDHEQLDCGLAEFLVRWWDRDYISDVFGPFDDRIRPGRVPSFLPQRKKSE
jgi:hypothetical protein